MGEQDSRILKCSDSNLQEFYSKSKTEPFVDGLENALRLCYSAGYRPLYLPEILDLQTQNNLLLGLYSKELLDRIAMPAFFSGSVQLTGRTKQGRPISVYAHIPTYLSDPDNIHKSAELGLISNNSAVFPTDEFHRILGLEDNPQVFVVDPHFPENSGSIIKCVEATLGSPYGIGFAGGNERMKKSLELHKKCGAKTLLILHNDLHEQPTARYLFIGVTKEGIIFGAGMQSYAARVIGIKKL